MISRGQSKPEWSWVPKTNVNVFVGLDWESKSFRLHIPANPKSFLRRLPCLHFPLLPDVILITLVDLDTNQQCIWKSPCSWFLSALICLTVYFVFSVGFTARLFQVNFFEVPFFVDFCSCATIFCGHWTTLKLRPREWHIGLSPIFLWFTSCQGIFPCKSGGQLNKFGSTTLLQDLYLLGRTTFTKLCFESHFVDLNVYFFPAATSNISVAKSAKRSGPIDHDLPQE